MHGEGLGSEGEHELVDDGGNDREQNIAEESHLQPENWSLSDAPQDPKGGD